MNKGMRRRSTLVGTVLAGLLSGAWADEGSGRRALVLDSDDFVVRNGIVSLAHAQSVSFAHDFADGTNGWTLANHAKRLDVSTGRTLDRDCLRFELVRKLEGKTSAARDTAWCAVSPRFPVRAGSPICLKLVFAASARIKTGKSHGDLRSGLAWFDRAGRELEFHHVDLHGVADRWTESRYPTEVPSGAVEAQVSVGFDDPDFCRGDFVALASVEVRERRPENGYPRMATFRTQMFRAKDADAASEKVADCPPGTSVSLETSESNGWTRLRVRLTGTGSATPALSQASAGGVRFSCFAPADEHKVRVSLLTDSPTEDRASPVRIRLRSPVDLDWERLQVRLNGKPVQDRLRRTGTDLEIAAPAGGWPCGSYARVAVSGKDVEGLSFADEELVFFGPKLTENLVTLRDDGMVLVDGRPFFPIGTFGVYPNEANGRSYDRALRDLREIGCNFVQTYPAGRHGDRRMMDEFLNAADRYGFKAFVRPGKNFLSGDVAEDVIADRAHPCVLAWYLGDDTADHITPWQVERSHRFCRAIDNAHICTHADTPGKGMSRYLPYIHATEAYLPEIYTTDVAEFVSAMRQIAADKRKAGDVVRSVWPIVRYYAGFGAKSYPSYETLRSISWQAVIQGGRGLTWYTYHSFRDGLGSSHTPETWATFSKVVKEMSAYVDDFSARDARIQPQIKILRGPKTDHYGNPSVVCLLKDSPRGPLLMAGNSSTNAVSATLTLPARPPIRIDFEPNGVRVQRLKGASLM